MHIKWLYTTILIAAIVCTSLPEAGADGLPTVTVFAAASTTNAINDINALFEQNKLGKALASFAASSTLAMQIDKGAPADVYLSANIKWMDYLAGHRMIDLRSRRNLLSNSLVLICPADSKLKTFQISAGFPLADLLGNGRLAIGNPDYVPAGIYGKQALVSLNVWDSVANKLAPAKDVRTALMLVERGEAPIGLVYATDAAITPKVRVLGIFPQTSHPPITYPVAIIKDHDNQATRRYLDFLSSPKARAIFEKYGFSVR